MKSVLSFALLIVFSKCYADDSLQYNIKINFLYGSKPAKGFKDSESKLFGGLKGGHVNIEADGKVLDFMPGNNPLFPKNKKPTGCFRLSHSVYWNTGTDKWKTVIIPVTKNQFSDLLALFDSLPAKAPYDYAVFGMRCAAATYYVLSQIALFEELSERKNIVQHFYPKLLRKKILKWAVKHNFTITTNEGRSSRKWETDKGIL